MKNELEMAFKLTSSSNMSYYWYNHCNHLKTVSLVSGQILSKVRTSKNAENKQEIEQSLARSQSMLHGRVVDLITQGFKGSLEKKIE